MIAAEPALDAIVAITLPGPSWSALNAVCLDTATDQTSIALVEQGEIVAEQQWRSGRFYTEQLACRLKGLAAEAQFELKSVELLCVCVGPGSFNGIRTGVATAIGLADGFGVPVYGISSLDLIAYAHADRAPAQRAVLPAGRNEYYSALYGTRGGRWRRMSPYTIATLATLAADSPAKCLWCGLHGFEAQEEVAAHLGGARRVIAAPHNVRRAAYMLPLALAAAGAGADGAASSVQPLYLKRPAITEPRRAATFAAAGA